MALVRSTSDVVSLTPSTVLPLSHAHLPPALFHNSGFGANMGLSCACCCRAIPCLTERPPTPPFATAPACVQYSMNGSVALFRATPDTMNGPPHRDVARTFGHQGGAFKLNGAMI